MKKLKVRKKFIRSSKGNKSKICLENKYKDEKDINKIYKEMIGM